MLRYREDWRTLLWAASCSSPRRASRLYVDARVIPWMLPLEPLPRVLRGHLQPQPQPLPGRSGAAGSTPSTRPGSASSTVSRPFAWIPTHNLNHHKFVNKAGDATITWRYTKKHNWTIASTYYFVSAYWQGSVIKEYIAKAKANNPSLYRPRSAGQYATLIGAQVSLLALAIFLHRDAWWRGVEVWGVRVRHSGAVRELVDDLHQLHPARPRRPLVGAQPFAQLRLEARKLARLQQRVPHRPPRERGACTGRSCRRHTRRYRSPWSTRG